MAFKEGKVTEEDLLFLTKDILKIWKRLGRALKLEEYIIDQIEIDIKDVYEQSLAMLRRWYQSRGSRATYKELGEALSHPTVDCGDLAKRFCCYGTQVHCSVTIDKMGNKSNAVAEMNNLSLKEDDEMLSQSVPSISILLGEPFHKTYQRNKELQTLHDLYHTLDPDTTCNNVTMVYITGPPGSGKSQLSRLYAKWYGQRDCANKPCATVVATLHAETPESLLESYRRLTCALGIKLSDVAKYDDVKNKLSLYSCAVRNLFQESRLLSFDWLIVVDNVVASEPLKEFWPMPDRGWGRGRVVVTTQDAELAPSAHAHVRTLSLSEGMDQEDAIDFLSLISELQRDGDCETVARQLNYYPLSLACAAVFVRDMRRQRPAANFSWKDYLKNLDKYFEHLKYSEFTDHNICYPRSMLSAAFCSASRMSEGNSILQSAFNFLSHCTLQPVPLDLVADAVQKTIQDEVLIPDEVMKTLARCSLLIYPRNGARGVEVITMHQVMRAAFIQLRKEACKVAMETALAGLGTTLKMEGDSYFMETLDTMCSYYHRFQTIDEHAISTRILLSPHLQDCVNTANSTKLTDNEEFVDASVCLADSLIHVAGAKDYHRVQLLETAKEIQSKLQLTNLCACRLLSDLGYTYREAGQLDKVIPVLEEANAIAEQHDGIEWMKQRSHILNVLGFTYREKYQLDLATAYMQMCVDVTKQVYGNEHAEVIERLCNYGIILHDSWKNEEAIQVLEEAYNITETLGIDSQSAVLAQVFNYTAKIYLRWFLGLIHSEGMTERAKTFLHKSKGLHEQALEIYDHLHGKEHKFYAGTLMTYTMVLLHVGQTDLALAQCKEAVRVYRSSGHIAWPRAHTWLADIHFAKGEYDIAKMLLEQAIQGNEDLGITMISPGAYHPHALLAEALMHTGEREQGEKLLQKCIGEWNEQGFHRDHYWVVRARTFLERIQEDS